MWKTIANLAEEILFPEKCIKCGREKEGYICLDCAATMEILDRTPCPYCHGINPPDYICGKHRSHLRRLCAAVRYQDLLAQNAIKLLKYEPCVKNLSQSLAKIIWYHLQLSEISQDIIDQFAIVAVPLHISRLKKRGYNQSEEIAKHLSNSLKIPLIANGLERRAQKGQTQVLSDKAARLFNVEGCFSVPHPEKINCRKILLVDDVFTTGATLEECAKVLKQNGSEEIWGVVFARGS